MKENRYKPCALLDGVVVSANGDLSSAASKKGKKIKS